MTLFLCVVAGAVAGYWLTDVFKKKAKTGDLPYPFVKEKSHVLRVLEANLEYSNGWTLKETSLIHGRYLKTINVWLTDLKSEWETPDAKEEVAAYIDSRLDPNWKRKNN